MAVHATISCFVGMQEALDACGVQWGIYVTTFVAVDVHSSCRPLHDRPVSLMHLSGKGKPWDRLDAGRPCPLDHTWKSYDLLHCRRWQQRIVGLVELFLLLLFRYETGDHAGVYSQKSVDTVNQPEMLLGLSQIQLSPYMQTLKMKLNRHAGLIKNIARMLRIFVKHGIWFMMLCWKHMGEK